MRLHKSLFLILLLLVTANSYSTENSCQADPTHLPENTISTSWWNLKPILSSLQYVAYTVAAAKTAIDIRSDLSSFGETLKQESEHFCPKLPENMPEHVAMIMDGNRRYAKGRSLDQPSYGHFFGAARLLQVTRIAEKLGINQLTVYALSTENLARPEEEIAVLMAIVRSVLEHWEKELVNSSIRVQHLGFRAKLSKEVLQAIDSIVEKTRTHTGLTLNIAFNYGGQAEFVHAVSRILSQSHPDTKVDYSLIQQNLLTGGLAGWIDPALVIRTGGRKRLSNFLALQTLYSELHFTDTLWPDFTPQQLLEALNDYSQQQRNFGL